MKRDIELVKKILLFYIGCHIDTWPVMCPRFFK